MAVPKKRTGKSAQAKRRANWKATVPATTICKTCNEIIPTHTVCPKCGSYKGKVVSIKNSQKEAVVEETKPEVKAEDETKEEKPKAKRTRKPKAKAEEVTEAKTEETKEEKTEE